MGELMPLWGVKRETIRSQAHTYYATKSQLTRLSLNLTRLSLTLRSKAPTNETESQLAKIRSWRWSPAILKCISPIVPPHKTKQSIVERYNRTQRELLERYMTAYNTKTYYKVLKDFTSNYNTTEHSTTKEKPSIQKMQPQDAPLVYKMNLA